MQFFEQFLMNTPAASLTDTTPPTFGGVTALTPIADGSIEVAWNAASDSTPPIEYLIYIALGSVNATALFVPGNISAIAPAGALSKRVHTLGDQTTYLVNGLLYTIGVRARDAVGNIDTNPVTMTETAIGSGNLPQVMQDITTTIKQAAQILLSKV